ncbi:MAG: hypothetical protein Q8P18_11770 [Pseudomonadota bacterium]|nr:hypothetical protein [Pseudomonadota bacterium]
MRTMTFVGFAALGLVAGCQTEREEAREAVQDVREAEREAAQDVRQVAEEGREDVAEARREMVKELRDLEQSGEPVEFDAVVTGSDPDTVNLRLPSGETFDVEYTPTIRIMRGENIVAITEIRPGTTVHVTYRVIDGKRTAQQIVVAENGGATPGAGGGTR